MSAAARTPSDLVITPRNRAFGRDKSPGHWWYGGNPAATAFYNALSLTFPRGETFFIESVRHFRGEVSEPLHSQIAEFIKQEAIHTREHIHFNRQVKDAGYDLAEIDAKVAKLAAVKKSRTPLDNLTLTVALEHFTAILAKAWLSNDRYFQNAPTDVMRLWRWHAMEEIEHKGVAYDTFLAVTAPMTGAARWKLRALVMLAVTRRFLAARFDDMAIMFKQDGVNTPRTWIGVANYLLIYPGLLRQIFPDWLAFFKPGFHPWEHDDRALLRQAEAALGPEGQLGPA